MLLVSESNVMMITLTMTRAKLDPTETNKSIFCNRLMERGTSYEKESFVARFQVQRQRDGPREVIEPYGRQGDPQLQVTWE
jgi:hypothetical protein